MGWTVLFAATCGAVAVAAMPSATPAAEVASADSAAAAIHVGLEATTSIWWTIREEVENGLRQSGSEDPADDVASGFNFRQGRLGLSFSSGSGALEALLRVRLEERTDLIDFWGLYRPVPSVALVAGQMKIPSTGEVLAADNRLDFITRTTFGRIVCDYALARTPYISPLMAVKSYDRDLGIAARLDWPAARPRARAFFMVGNGLGGNRYVGGEESPEFLFTNGIGEHHYGIRLEARLRERAAGLDPGCEGDATGTRRESTSRLPWIEELALGAHGSLNRHEDVALDARGPVLDFDREARSVDLRASFAWGQRIEGFLGSGELDDNWGGARYRFDYSGWGIWSLWAPGRGSWEIGLRHDRLESGYRQARESTVQRHWTVGANWRPRPPLRLQLNYVAKATAGVADPDRSDDIAYLNVQYTFATDLSAR
jgi:hypothetical protein